MAVGIGGGVTTMMAAGVGDGQRAAGGGQWAAGGGQRRTAIAASEEADDGWGSSGTDLIFMLKHLILDAWWCRPCHPLRPRQPLGL